MTDLLSYPISVVAHGYQSANGGTCFLDLRLELRTMIYDLSMSSFYDCRFPLPGQPKPKAKGINLLQSCKQVRQETQKRVWCRGWTVSFSRDTSSINLRLATSSLNDLALAKITDLDLEIEINPTTLSSWGPIDLGLLPTFKSLFRVDIMLLWGHYLQQTWVKKPEDLSKSVFLTGLVIQILSQTPQHIPYVSWDLCFYNGGKIQFSAVPESIAKKYRHLQGSEHLPKISNPYDSSSSPASQTTSFYYHCADHSQPHPTTPIRANTSGHQIKP